MLVNLDIETNGEEVRIEKREDGYYWKDFKLECKFFETNHTYWLGFKTELTDQGDEVFYRVKQLTSVTSLMKKYNLVTGYGNVPQYILKRKAERGTLIHKELENWVKNDEVGFSNELNLFIQASAENDIEPISSEYIVFNDVVAGTVDLKCKMRGFNCKADYKTTSSYDEDYLSWQLSIYNYLDINKDERLYCFHFHNDKLDIIQVPEKSAEEIERLFDMERGIVEPEPNNAIVVGKNLHSSLKSFQ